MQGQTYKWAWHIQKLLVGQYELSLLAREEVGRCDDEVELKTQFMRTLHLMLRNLHFIMKTWTFEVLSKKNLEGYTDNNVNMSWNEVRVR